MNDGLFRLVIGVLSIISIILIIMIIVITRNNKKTLDKGIFVRNKGGIRNLYEKLYVFLDEMPLTRRFVRIYSRQFELYYHGDSKEYSYQTIKLIVKSLVTSLTILIFFFLINPSLFSMIVSLMLCYIFIIEQNCAALSSMEISFLKSFDLFISEVRHGYYKCGSVRDALFFAISEQKGMMRGHAEQLYTILNSKDIASATEEYMNEDYHKYLKLFLSMAEMVEENGDVVDKDGSVFLNSCMQLRNDIQEERRYIEERKHKFAALSYTAGIPVVAVPFIADWGVSTIPSLVDFYMGHTGFVIKAVLVTITYLCFCAIVRLREGDRLTKKTLFVSEKIAQLKVPRYVLTKYINKNYGKSMKKAMEIKRLCEKYTVKAFYVHKWIVAIEIAMVMIILVNVGHYESRNIILTDISDVSNLSTSADGRQIEAMEENIIKYVWMFLKTDDDSGMEIIKGLPQETITDWIAEKLLEERGIRTVEVAEVTAREIVRRIGAYQSEYFGLSDVLIVLGFGCFAFLYPSLTLRLRNHLNENKMQEEVIQFQSIIHMLKKVPGVSAVSLLEEMENFSEIFKDAIQKCLNDYGISDREALERLYEAEEYIGLRRIVDCFFLVDEMGVEDAFEEISADIINFRDNRKLERSMLLDTEGMIGTLVAVIPGGAILFGHLLCPFLVRSVQIFSSYQAELGTLVG